MTANRRDCLSDKDSMAFSETMLSLAASVWRVGSLARRLNRVGSPEVTELLSFSSGVLNAAFCCQLSLAIQLRGITRLKLRELKERFSTFNYSEN